MEREYRRDDSRKRDSDEGEIARYERYRYNTGQTTPQYNDIGSEWSMEQLANQPDDIDGTLNHTGGEVLDESSLPSMNWERDDISRGDPLEDEWDYYEVLGGESLQEQLVTSNKIDARQVKIANTEKKSEEKAKGDRSTAPKSSEPLFAQSSPNTKQQEQSQPLNVANLSVTEKLAETMRRAAMKLPKSVGEQLLAMVNPTSLTIMVGVLGAYAASHTVGVGVLADAVMAVGAGATIGWQAVSAGKDLWGFAQFINATTEEDLDKAASDLANFVATVGIDVVLGILVKKAAGKAKNYGDDLNRVDEVHARHNSNTHITVPSNLSGLSGVEYQKLTGVATAKGLKNNAITDLYNELGLKTIQNLALKSDDEIAAALKAIQLEKLDGGHSIARHGAQIEDRALKDRVTTGIAPDGAFSPTPASTRFINHKMWLGTREIAWKKIEEIRKVDLSKPKTSNSPPSYEVRIKYNKPIDEGFVADLSTANKVKVSDPITGKKKKGKVYSSVNAIDGVTATYTKVIWDANSNKWVVVQHYPYAEGWNNIAKNYSIGTPIDATVNLP